MSAATKVLSMPPPALGMHYGAGWQVVSQLAESPTAFVLLVRGPADQMAALKVFRIIDPHGDARARFLREIEAGRATGHPAVVPVHEVGVTDQGQPFFVMSLLHGHHLEQRLERGGLPVGELLRIADQILDFAEASHSAGVLHRDLRPSNVFIEDSGQVRILDFGVARLPWAPGTAPGVILGSPNYMAPEQARGELIDARADLYAIGAILYRSLGGRSPHQGSNATDVLWKVGSMPAPAIGRVASNLPPALASFVAKATGFEPMLRFRSAREMRAELHKVRSSLPQADLARQLPPSRVVTVD